MAIFHNEVLYRFLNVSTRNSKSTEAISVDTQIFIANLPADPTVNQSRTRQGKETDGSDR